MPKHPSLSSRAARASLSHLNELAKHDVVRAIDQLSTLYDGLSAIHSTANPMHTREKRAADYRRQFDSAMQRRDTVVSEARDSVLAHEHRVVEGARARLGIGAFVKDASEIRAALRSMSQTERDAAMSRSIEAGDFEPLNACMGANPILTGQFTTPVETMLKLVIETAAPEVAQAYSDTEVMLTHLNLAAGGFRASADALRDPLAEQNGIDGEAASEQAEKAFKLAMAGKTEVVHNETVEAVDAAMRHAQSTVIASGSTMS